MQIGKAAAAPRAWRSLDLGPIAREAPAPRVESPRDPGFAVTDSLTVSVLPCATRAQPSQWVRGPVWDAVFMQNALWLLPLVLWLAYGRADPSAGPLDILYFGFTALFWISHRFGSAGLVYATEAYRPLLKAQPVRFIAIPLLVAIL